MKLKRSNCSSFLQIVFSYLSCSSPFMTIAFIFILLRYLISESEAFEIPVLNLNEAEADQIGNGPLPAWAKNSNKRVEFFKSVHSVSVDNQEFVGLQRKWLEQGYANFVRMGMGLGHCLHHGEIGKRYCCLCIQFSWRIFVILYAIPIQRPWF